MLERPTPLAFADVWIRIGHQLKLCLAEAISEGREILFRLVEAFAVLGRDVTLIGTDEFVFPGFQFVPDLITEPLFGGFSVVELRNGIERLCVGAYLADG